MQLFLTIILPIVIIIGLVILSVFFSSSEIATRSLNRYRLRYLIKKNNKQAIRINQLLSRPHYLLNLIVISNTTTNLIAAMLATLVGQRLYGNIGMIVAIILLIFVIIVFTEILPHALSPIYSQQVAFLTLTSRPLKIIQIIFAPLISMVAWIRHRVLILFNISMDKIQNKVLSEEVRSMLYEVGDFLPVEYKTMLISLLDLEKITVEDIMITKADIIGLDLEQPWHRIVAELEMAQHTRLPLYRGSIDNLVGLIHVRNILNLVLEKRLNLENLLKRAESPYFVPEATPLNIQILNFQKMKKRSCFVVDEYGDLLGMVSLEDILEEVVGEFTPDITDLSKDIIQQSDGSVLVDASITLRHLHRLLGWQFSFTGPRTLSGFIIEYLGYIPPHDCCLRIESYQIEILKVSENMIKTVRMLRVVKKDRD